MPLKTETNADTVAPELLAWWHVNGRKDFAWQQNPTRYRVWISEVMLQQTQVTTVVPYYQRFIAEFPTVRDLAAADPDRVLHVWSGLGYYARARNLHKAAGLISAKFDGELPGDIDALQSLPGIGRSTAGAILALADDRRHPILDGNAKRVYARFFAIAGWPGQGAVLKKLWALAEACTPATGAAIYTQAIMDLGATVCLRRNPGARVVRWPIRVLRGNSICLTPFRVSDQSAINRSVRPCWSWPYVMTVPSCCKDVRIRESGAGCGAFPKSERLPRLPDGAWRRSVIYRAKYGFARLFDTALRISTWT